MHDYKQPLSTSNDTDSKHLYIIGCTCPCRARQLRMIPRRPWAYSKPVKSTLNLLQNLSRFKLKKLWKYNGELTQNGIKSSCWWETLSRPMTRWASSGMPTPRPSDRSLGMVTRPPVYWAMDLSTWTRPFSSSLHTGFSSTKYFWKCERNLSFVQRSVFFHQWIMDVYN